MALPGEFEYYAARSGLPAGTLADHKQAYFMGLAPAGGTSQGAEFAYYRTELGGNWDAFDDVRLAYYRLRSGLVTGTVTDCQIAFFASPPVPPVVTTTTLTPLTVGVPFSQQLVATGTTPITYALSLGSLPTGLSLSSTGLISGTPTVAAAYNFAVTATNRGGVDAQVFTGAVLANEITNPGFEVDLLGWSANASTTARVTAEKHSGVASASVLTNGTADSGMFWGPGPLGSWVVGNPVSTAAWVKAPAAALMRAQLVVVGGTTGTAQLDFVGTGAWQYVEIEGGVIAGAFTSAPYVYISNRAVVAAFTFYVDDVALVKNATI